MCQVTLLRYMDAVPEEQLQKPHKELRHLQTARHYTCSGRAAVSFLDTSGTSGNPKALARKAYCEGDDIEPRFRKAELCSLGFNSSSRC